MMLERRKQVRDMKLTVIQPRYYAGETPDEQIAAFLLQQAELAEEDSLVVMPEYANAGGLSDPEKLVAALPRAQWLLAQASAMAKRKGIYLAVNVFEQRDGKRRNSTYLLDKQGNTAFIYDKVHLPPAEVKLGIVPGDGRCVCDLEGIRFGFMTCYDVYFNEQTEFIAAQKPDLILVPGYQRGERWDIIQAQTKMLAFRCNAHVARASVSMDSLEKGGNTMIVAPDGQILVNLGSAVGSVTAEVDPKWKYMRPAGFGGSMVRNDDFINQGLRPDVF
jgi:predicted amidohydrolase